MLRSVGIDQRNCDAIAQAFSSVIYAERVRGNSVKGAADQEQAASWDRDLPEISAAVRLTGLQVTPASAHPSCTRWPDHPISQLSDQFTA